MTKDRLQDRLTSARSSTAIQCDNPEANSLLLDKLKRLEAKRDEYKAINKAVRQCKGNANSLMTLLKIPGTTAAKLLTPDFAGRIGIPGYVLTNLGAEIRRLKKRIEQVAVVQSDSFEAFSIGDIEVELVCGQIQIEFPWKPNEESRLRVKRLAFKWSRYSSRWVRKHTASTCGAWFKSQLVEALTLAVAE